MSTLNGFYGLLAIPDYNTVRFAVHLTEKVRDADYLVRTEGVHVTLFQARTFRMLPVSVARALTRKLHEYLVAHPEGEALLPLRRVEPYTYAPQYLFWNVDRPERNERLRIAHGMSLALSAWVDPPQKRDPDAAFTSDQRTLGDEMALKHNANTRMFGHSLVGDEFLPHVTIAAGAKYRFKPRDEFHPGAIQRVVFAQMGEWGKIEKVLF